MKLKQVLRRASSTTERGKRAEDWLGEGVREGTPEGRVIESEADGSSALIFSIGTNVN